MVYKADYRQQHTGYMAHLAYCTMGTVSLSWGDIGWSLALDIQRTLTPSLKKVYSYNSTTPYGYY